MLPSIRVSRLDSLRVLNPVSEPGGVDSLLRLGEDCRIVLDGNDFAETVLLQPFRHLEGAVAEKGPGFDNQLRLDRQSPVTSGNRAPRVPKFANPSSSRAQDEDIPAWAVCTPAGPIRPARPGARGCDALRPSSGSGGTTRAITSAPAKIASAAQSIYDESVGHCPEARRTRKIREVGMRQRESTTRQRRFLAAAGTESDAGLRSREK